MSADEGWRMLHFRAEPQFTREADNVLFSWLTLDVSAALKRHVLEAQLLRPRQPPCDKAIVVATHLGEHQVKAGNLQALAQLITQNVASYTCLAIEINYTNWGDITLHVVDKWAGRRRACRRACIALMGRRVVRVLPRDLQRLLGMALWSMRNEDAWE